MRWATDLPASLPVIVVGTSPWSVPWLTEQNLAFALAERHPVLYVEPPQIEPRRHDRDGRLRLRRERLHGREVIVYRPVVLPLRSRAASGRASAPLYRRQLSTLVRRLGMRDGVVISGDARPGLVGAAHERLSIYLVKDWVYDDADLLGRSPADLRLERDEICSKVDLVLAISPNLKTSLAGVGISAEVLRHGFHADLVAAYDSPEPPEYATLARPRIVFAGRLDARLDIAKLVRLGRRLPEASIVLIGPVSPRMPADDLAALEGQVNIHLIGARPRSTLPSYLAHADCLLIPYRDTVWARHGSPLKLWDYLYAGPPIVGSGYSVLSEYLPMVSFANDDERFVAQVADAIADGSDGAAERRDFALANTWDERGQQLESIAAAALANGTGG